MTDGAKTIRAALLARIESRVGQGHSLRSVATGAGVDYGGLYRFRESGGTLNVSITTAERLAAYFGLKLTQEQERANNGEGSTPL